jgi:hypothetical protein
VVPEEKLNNTLKWSHEKSGHTGIARTLDFFKNHFYTRVGLKDLKDMIQKLTSSCPCTLTKQNSASDRGLVSSYPIPYQCNSVVYMDFIEMPKYGGMDFAMMITCGLSRFSRVVPCSKKLDSEGALKILLEEWVQAYGLPRVLHLDQDIRMRSPTCWYQKVFQSLGVEVQLGIPYQRQHNGLYERQKKAFGDS